MHQGTSRRAGHKRWLLLVAVFGLGWGSAYGELQARQVGALSILGNGGDGADPVANPAAFRVPGESQQTTDAVADFEQLLADKQWDKAFRAMEAFQSASPVPMVRTEDGFVVPVDLYSRRKLASLPPDGRQAFRVFNDARAKALMDKPEGSPEELAALEKVYQKFLISSFGPAAADRLGDTCFERGDFSRAARCWADILAYCSDSTIPPARLYVKQATALARSGDWARFEEVQRRVQAKFPGEKVVLGGRDLPAAEYLAALAKERDAATPSAAGPAAADSPIADKIPIPRSDAPAWKYEFLTEQLRQQAALAIQNNGYSTAMLDSLRPVAESDGARVFINWFGSTTALDGDSGKLLWQTDKPETMPQRIQNMVNYGVFKGGALLLERGLVLSVGYETNRMPYARIACYAADSGKVKWNTSTDSGLQEYCFLGSPVIEGDTIYCTALKQMRGELSLVAIDFNTGTKRWDLVLGVPTQNPRGGNNVDLDPQIEVGNDQVFVLTNDGALVAVDPMEKRVAWAYMYGPGRKMFANVYRRRGTVPPTVGQSGDLPIEQGILYFKDKGQEELHAVDISDRSVVWKKEVGTAGAILGIIDGDLYVLGDALTAYKPRTLERRWWSELFGGNAGAPLFTQSQVYLFGSAGLFGIDRKSGKVVQMLTEFEKDPSGGSVLAAGKSLIVVTDSAAVGYKTN